MPGWPRTCTGQGKAPCPRLIPKRASWHGVAPVCCVPPSTVASADVAAWSDGYRQGWAAGWSAAAADAGTDGRGSQRPILFIMRRSVVRMISNFGDISAALSTADGASAVDGARVRFQMLEELTLAQQLAAVAAASVLVGVHGQGMVWTSMLFTEGTGGERRRCAALELFPSQMLLQRTHAWFDYRRWAAMNHVEYFLLLQPDEPVCKNQDFRRCGNMSVVPSELVAAMRLVHAHAEATDRPPLNALDWSSRQERERWAIGGRKHSVECIRGARQEGARSCHLSWM